MKNETPRTRRRRHPFQREFQSGFARSNFYFMYHFPRLNVPGAAATAAAAVFNSSYMAANRIGLARNVKRKQHSKHRRGEFAAEALKLAQCVFEQSGRRFYVRVQINWKHLYLFRTSCSPVRDENLNCKMQQGIEGNIEVSSFQFPMFPVPFSIFSVLCSISNYPSSIFQFHIPPISVIIRSD